MASPHLPTTLSPRSAVTDCIFRFACGLNTNDQNLVKSESLKTEDINLVVGDHTIEG
jgi:hypothetical protein